jgi:hypothetical protein
VRVTTDLGRIALLVALGAVVVAITFATSDAHQGSDALFYEAQTEELQGATAQEGREEWFSGPEARAAAVDEDEPEDKVRVLDPEWVEYSAQFYRRRWVVPAMSAAVDPIVGEERLRVVSVAGYLLIGPLLFLLLRLRFSPGTSLAVAAACILLPPVIDFCTHRGVDSWGLALEAASMLFLALAVDRELTWIVPFALAMLVLSFTRDNTLAPLAGAALLLWRQRGDLRLRRRNLALTGTAFAASLPAPLIFGTPLRDQLAYAIDAFDVPTDTSWGYILTHYPNAAAHVVYYDLRYPVEHAFAWVATPFLVLMLVGLAGSLWVLLRHAPRDDPYFTLAQGAFAGGLVLLLIAVNYQSYRLELIWLPCVAVGAALWMARQSGTPKTRRSQKEMPYTVARVTPSTRT